MRTKNFLRWTPRILAILFTIFISLFALDVFDEGYNLSELLTTLLMHSIPTLFFALVTLLAWKKPRLGGMIFVILAMMTIFAFETYKHFSSFLMISLVPLIIGALFVTGEKRK